MTKLEQSWERYKQVSNADYVGNTTEHNSPDPDEEALPLPVMNFQSEEVAPVEQVQNGEETALPLPTMTFPPPKPKPDPARGVRGKRLPDTVVTGEQGLALPRWDFKQADERD